MTVYKITELSKMAVCQLEKPEGNTAVMHMK